MSDARRKKRKGLAAGVGVGTAIFAALATLALIGLSGGKPAATDAEAGAHGAGHGAPDHGGL
jgi:hypothetical protein